MLEPSRNIRYLRMLAKIARPSSMAATMLAKLSSVSVIAAASRATSVPDRPIATPMSARRSAGASLTPSPVIATTWPRDCSASTIRSLCAGLTRAQTAMRSISRASAAASSWSSSMPVTTRPSPSRPSSRAIASAVAGWSPVIIITRMPARRQASSAGSASGRGGSIMPTRPSSTRPLSRLSRRASSRRAIASTRSALPAIASAAASTCAPMSASIGTHDPSARWIVLDAASTTSTAPFTQAKHDACSPRCSVLMRRRSASNGISSMRGCAASSAALCWPALAAAAISAPSVGSPFTCQRPSSARSSRASVHSAAAASRSRSAGLTGSAPSPLLNSPSGA